MIFDISNKKILLIGGNGLLGSQYINFLSKKVKFISVIDLDSNNIKKNLLEKNIKFFQSNISNYEHFVKTIKKSIKFMNGIDVLINNAALTAEFSVNNKKIFDEFNFQAWKESIDITLNGTYLGCTTVLPYMIKKKKGQIINIGSHYGVVSPNHEIYKNENFNCPVSYSASKSAVISLTKWMGTKYAKSGIRINCISPGGVINNQSKVFIKKYSKLNPMKRMAKKNEFNGILHYLISEESKYVIGQNFVIDGGATTW